MQQILNFIIKNSYRMLFLLLLLVSFGMIVNSHSYHRSIYINSANGLTGNLYEKTNSFSEYLSLKDKNKKLAEENARLKELLFNKKDTVLNFLNDNPVYENTYVVTKGKVIKNVYNTQENYLTLNIGRNKKVSEGMGVISNRGIVGVVENVSDNFATVISILHTGSRLNAKIKNSDHFGSLIWDGKNAGYVQLIEVPRLASLKKGDSIVTGSDSEIFPENIPIGKIDRVFIDTKTNYYTINVRLFNDMTSLGYVYTIKNNKKEEKQKLEKELEKNKLNTLLLNIFRFFLLLILQIVLFSNIDLFGFINPYPYILFILLYPPNENKSALLISSFFLGLVVDMALNSAGIHAFASTFLAFIRPNLFRVSFGVSYEYQTIKIADKITGERFSFIALSIFIHHSILFLFEFFRFSLIFEALTRALYTTIFTLIICFLIIYLIKKNKR